MTPVDTASEQLAQHPASPKSSQPHWLLTSRVTVPPRPAGHLDRPELVGRCNDPDHRITVLKAPGGFGKTTLMGEICRRREALGTLVAWLTVMQDDTPEVIGRYLAHAFQSAGLDLPDQIGWAEPRSPGLPSSFLASLIRAIERCPKPCLLALDDVERLTHRDTVETVGLLLRYCPRNLHFLIGCRSNPGLDLDAAVLAGHGISLGPEHLRFSKREIALLFDIRLSPTEIRALANRTEGWPAALQLHRDLTSNIRQSKLLDIKGEQGLAADYIGLRLLRGLSDEDRNFLLDLALFEWIDPSMADEVLGVTGSRHRIAALQGLSGLLQPIERGHGTLRLHPLVREYCVAQRFRETPDRFVWLQTRIARALASRNLLVPALRHATDAEADLVFAEITEGAGGLGLWFREGMTRLFAVDRLVKPAMIHRFPRIGLLRCIVLIRHGKMQQARDLFADLGRHTRDFSQDRTGGDDRRLYVESVGVKAMLAGFGCLALDSEPVHAILAEMASILEDPKLDHPIAGGYSLVLCTANYQRARFEVSRQYLLRARTHFAACGSEYGSMYCEIHAGIVSIARGRVQDAIEHLGRARKIARQRFPEDAGSGLIADAMLAETELERNRIKAVEQIAPDVHEFVASTGAWLDVFAAAYGVAAETTARLRSTEKTVAMLAEARQRFLALGFVSVARYLGARGVSALIATGQTQRARETWRACGLSDSASALLDLDSQSWREMEAVSLARVQLLAAQSEIDAARNLANRLCQDAAAHGLVRTLMRGLVASMVVEQHSGDEDRAMARLVEFLRLARTTDYLRPLVREADVSRTVLQRLLETGCDQDSIDAARALLRDLGPDGKAAEPVFTSRERDVLEQLRSGLRNRQIAGRLGLSENAVRFHLKNIYRKTGVSDRDEAVRRVRGMGVLTCR